MLISFSLDSEKLSYNFGNELARQLTKNSQLVSTWSVNTRSCSPLPRPTQDAGWLSASLTTNSTLKGQSDNTPVRSTEKGSHLL